MKKNFFQRRIQCAARVCCLSAAALAPLCSCSEKIPFAENSGGESISLSVNSSKVSLNGTEYVFEAGDEIVAVSSGNAVATLSNSAENPNLFSGFFDDTLGADSESFRFYLNCGSAEKIATASPVYVQEGKPWLTAVAENVGRNASTGKYNVSVALAAPEGVIQIALESDYDCSVDILAHKANIAEFNGTWFSGNKLSGLEVKAGKPYFVNVPEGMSGGFCLTVQKDGEGTMFTNFGSLLTILKNTVVKIGEFIPFSKKIAFSGFDTTWSLYKNGDTDAANSKGADWIDSGTVTVSYVGASSSLAEFKSLTVNVDGTEFVTTSSSSLSWNGKREFSWTVPATDGHTDWSDVIISASAVFSTPFGDITIDGETTRVISGLPYSVAPPSNSNAHPWTVTRGGNKISFGSEYLEFTRKGTSGLNKDSLVESPHFNIPENVPVAMDTDYMIKGEQVLITYSAHLKSYIGGLLKIDDETSNKDGLRKQVTHTGELTPDFNYVEFEKMGTTELTGSARVYGVNLRYADTD
ncbi:MAG: hypothetical protein ACI39U_04235 [Candidatus Cryptobacteroides sp.]